MCTYISISSYCAHIWYIWNTNNCHNETLICDYQRINDFCMQLLSNYIVVYQVFSDILKLLFSIHSWGESTDVSEFSAHKSDWNTRKSSCANISISYIPITCLSICKFITISLIKVARISTFSAAIGVVRKMTRVTRGSCPTWF